MSQQAATISKSKIETTIDNFKKFLLAKNANYGGTGLYPLNIFCPAGEHTGIESRIDDKLGRVKITTEKEIPMRKNDVVDLIGYLFLLCIKNNWIDFQDLID